VTVGEHEPITDWRQIGSCRIEAHHAFQMVQTAGASAIAGTRCPDLARSTASIRERARSCLIESWVELGVGHRRGNIRCVLYGLSIGFELLSAS